jgi:Asp-tRNA(Asn)/Glu-tRNA(Gln) amidotransferase A subunit family amidase
MPQGTMSRKEALRAMLATAATAGLPLSVVGVPSQSPADTISEDDLKALERLAGIRYTESERKQILEEVRATRKGFDSVRELKLDHVKTPAVVFEPVGAGHDPAARISVRTRSVRPQVNQDVDLAFATVAELGALIRQRRVTAVQLAEMAIARIRRHDPALLCTVSMLEERALAMARTLDAEAAAGKFRGPLHGIPCGVKDLLAMRGTKTTWGAAPYQNQVIDEDATVVRKLDAAGAVIVAKFTLGALAMNDRWFGGMTRNPWNPEQGSSGSSAGSASAVAAGLVPFAIGSETYGSIASPSLRCRTTGFRPSFGRVSRHGAMELSYTMDKIGPIARSAECCALVFAAISGRDSLDPTTVDQRFQVRARRDLRGVKIGSMLKSDDPLAKLLADSGAEIVERKFTAPPAGLMAILDVECSSAFDDFTRSGLADQLKDSFWPGIFRAARAIPAIEYVAAQRARRFAAERFLAEFGDCDVVVDDGISIATLLHTNLAGTPQAILPFGANDKNEGVSKSVMGKLYGDDRVLEVAEFIQSRTGFHRLRPPGFEK